MFAATAGALGKMSGHEMLQVGFKYVFTFESIKTILMNN